MKILISAFACNPYQGSESGVGWAAICRVARNHDVFVLVDSLNKRGWGKAKAEGIIRRIQVGSAPINLRGR